MSDRISKGESISSNNHLKGLIADAMNSAIWLNTYVEMLIRGPKQDSTIRECFQQIQSLDQCKNFEEYTTEQEREIPEVLSLSQEEAIRIFNAHIDKINAELQTLQEILRHEVFPSEDVLLRQTVQAVHIQGALVKLQTAIHTFLAHGRAVRGGGVYYG